MGTAEQGRQSGDDGGSDELSHAGNGTCSTVRRHRLARRVDLTAKRANGEFWNFCQEVDQQELVERRQQKERLETTTGISLLLTSQFPAFCRRWRMKTRLMSQQLIDDSL